MKYRLNYVSNSSSSSFIIIYKKFKDFFKFKNFVGFKQFEKDFKNIDPNQEVEYIEDLLRLIIRSEYDYRHDLTLISEINPTFNDLYDLIEKSKIPWEEYNNCIKPMTDLINKHFKSFPQFENAERKCRTNYLTPKEIKLVEKWKSKVRSDYYIKTFQNKLTKNIKQLSKKITKSLNENGYNVNCLSYEDHSSIGYYMEHCFMPFIRQNPERNYEIFILNGH